MSSQRANLEGLRQSRDYWVRRFDERGAALRAKLDEAKAEHRSDLDYLSDLCPEGWDGDGSEAWVIGEYVKSLEAKLAALRRLTEHNAAGLQEANEASPCCEMGTYECQVPVESGGKSVAIDRCLADVVQALNQAGIQTLASCCGHGDESIADIALADGRRLSLRGHTPVKPPEEDQA